MSSEASAMYKALYNEFRRLVETYGLKQDTYLSSALYWQLRGAENTLARIAKVRNEKESEET